MRDYDIELMKKQVEYIHDVVENSVFMLKLFLFTFMAGYFIFITIAMLT